ncbi:hypothetical protein FQA39_LY11154 [Lamprigera yunnana]|nr:hypothetical protein FQA39_LY11154 [Lamprigera yunnana]
MSTKQILDFTTEGDIAQIHKILLNSNSEEGDVDSEEEDTIIANFRQGTEEPQELCDTSLSSFQLHTYSSSEEDSLAVGENGLYTSNEDEPQVSNEDKLVVVNATAKLFGKEFTNTKLWGCASRSNPKQHGNLSQTLHGAPDIPYVTDIINQHTATYPTTPKGTCNTSHRKSTD